MLSFTIWVGPFEVAEMGQKYVGLYIMIYLTEKRSMETLRQRQSEFIGVSVDVGPCPWINNGNESRLSSLPTYLEHLAVYGLPGRVNQF